MSAHQCRWANVPAPPHHVSADNTGTSLLSTDFVSTFDDIRNSNTFQWEYGPHLQQAQIHIPERYLDQALLHSRPTSPTLALPSNEDTDEHEAHDARLAIALSLLPTQTLTLTADSDFSSSMPSTSNAAASSSAAPSTLSTSAPSSSQSNTFNIAAAPTHKPAINLATIHCFTLVYWDEDDKPALILSAPHGQHFLS
ncbi:hypothetical protein K438DRAFT_1952307 [Mycena galopus ATCC 62051]|nr:hypothetical protein K438DRAFT_1952307 [Mycena galopus ATCC 62051]